METKKEKSISHVYIETLTLPLLFEVDITSFLMR